MLLLTNRFHRAKSVISSYDKDKVIQKVYNSSIYDYYKLYFMYLIGAEDEYEPYLPNFYGSI